MTIAADATVTEISAALAAGITTSREVCQGCLDRIAATNAAGAQPINAIFWMHSSASILALADAADARWAAGTQKSAIDGIPFTLKGVHTVNGCRTTNGTSAIDSYPGYDGDIAAKLLATGAILLGKTSIGGNPAQGICPQQSPPLYPEVRNPQALGYATGGSSSGAAAAVSANYAPFDIGVDAAGSIRIPASFCGVYGLKATRGVIPSWGDRSFLSPSRPPMGADITYHYGPITRSLDDLALLLDIIAGPTARRPETPPLAPLTSPTLAKVVKLDGIGVWWLSAFVQTKLNATCAALATAGKTVVTNATPQIPSTVFNQTIFDRLYAAVQNNPEAIAVAAPVGETDWTPSILNYAGQTETQAQGRAEVDYIRRKVNDLLADADFIITGSTALSPPVYGGTPVNFISYMAFAGIFDLTGHPAISIPAGTDPATGVPFGIQIIGRHFRDRDLIALGQQLEAFL